MAKIHVLRIKNGKPESRVIHGEEPKYHVKIYIEYKTNPDRASYYCELRICERPYDIPSEIEEVKEEFGSRFGSVNESLDTDMCFTLHDIIELIEVMESILASEDYPIVSRELKIESKGGDYPTIKVEYTLYE